MDALLLLKALIQGIVEGLTEFLPISSTGHLIISGDLLDFHDDKAKVFEVVIQLGAILAVCWEYRHKLADVTRGLARDAGAQRFAANVLVAFLPAAFTGLLFHDFITDHLFQPHTVAVALIVGGFFILWVEGHEKNPRIHDVDAIRWHDALKVGFAQCVALIPGVSRAGATIIGGELAGLSRKTATEFSFFLAIPIMVAASGYDLYKNWALFEARDLGVFATGFITAFVSALFAVKGLLRYIAHHSFAVFAWYRIVFGALVLWYFGWR